MVEKKIVMNSSLETNQVALLVQKCNGYKSEINLYVQEKAANAKSIMGVISLGMLDDKEITIAVDGQDEQRAMDFVHNYLATLV